MSGTKAERLEWLVNVRGDGNARKFARDAGLENESHLSVLFGRLRKDPSADAYADLMARLAKHGRVHLEWLVSGTGPRDIDEPYVVHEARYPTLERVIEKSEKTWSEQAIAAARSMSLDADNDPDERWWSEQLDRFEQALKLAAMPAPKKLPDRGVDPLADLDDVQAAPKKRR